MSDGSGAPGQPARASNLQLRVVSSVVLIGLALALTWAGGFWYRLLVAAICVAVFYEWQAMAGERIAAAHRIVGAVLMGLLVIALLAGLPTANLLAILIAVLVAGAAHAFYAGSGVWLVSGIAYAGLSAIALAAIRGGDDAGFAATLFLFAVVWATDIFAYFVGRSVGGPKLAPSISPGKTRSGAIGGAAAGVVAGLVVAIAAGASGGMVAAGLAALVLSIVSQAGDLFESFLKRRNAVKDSGHLIPGHGGVMDRVDGLVAAAVALFLAGAVLAGLDAPAHTLFGR
jgi:phosphatidate cytidylyltransferase